MSANGVTGKPVDKGESVAINHMCLCLRLFVCGIQKQLCIADFGETKTALGTASKAWGRGTIWINAN